MPTIATWNVNSIKSRLPHVLQYLDDAKPDVVLLQELKTIEDNFPFMEIEEKGYNVAAYGQKTYNGVAILSKHPIEDVQKGLPGNEEDPQARYIEAVITIEDEAWRVASVYVPNGQSPDSDKFPYKMGFLDCLEAHAKTLLTYEEKLVIGGDYNIAPEPQDVYAPKQLEGSVCFHRDERAKYRKLIHLGLTDAYRAIHPQEADMFSWWDYRGGGWQQNKGMRIDHLLLSPEAADSLKDADIDKTPRGWDKASDHTPVWAEIVLS